MAKPKTTNQSARTPLGARELARRSPDGLEVRRAPLRVPWELSNLTTSDGHTLRCSFGCAVQPNDRPADRRMLMETLLSGRDAASAEDLVRHFQPAMRTAGERAAAMHTVEALLADDGAAKQQMLDALRTAANAAGFASGIDIVPPLHIELQSPTFARERMESMQRRLAERRAAGQVEHVHRAAELLKQFRTLRDAAPELTPGRLLERVSSSDRGTMLEALLLASDDGGDPPPLWAVAGPALVRIDSIGSGSQPRIVVTELPTTLGPLRSVNCVTVDGERVLLVGARGGVMMVDPNDPASARSYSAPESGSPLGFNSVVAWDGKFWATHREVGLVSWPIDQPEQCDVVPETDLAHVRVVGERLMYSRGSELRGRTRGGGEIQPMPLEPEVIVGIVPRGDGCIVVCASGEVVALGRGDESHPPQRRCGRVRSATALPWLGDSRLLLATDDGPVCCVGVDDSLVTQYVSPHRGLKAIAAANGLVAGVTGDRQRIVLWHSWDGTRPIGEVHVGAQTKHRVADLCFG